MNYTDPTGEFLYGDTMTSMGTYAKLASNAYDASSTIKDYAEIITSAGTFRNVMIGVATSLAIDYIGGKMFEKVADLGANVMRRYRGGRYGDMKLSWGDGLESHHMPAKSTYDMDLDDMPAIQWIQAIIG